MSPPAQDEAGNSVFSLFMLVSVANHDLAKLVIAREHLVERFELAQRLWLNRPAHMLIDKRLEPISQRARLRCNGVEFTRTRGLPESAQHTVRDQARLLDPREQILSRGQPLDLGVHRNRNGIEEV